MIYAIIILIILSLFTALRIIIGPTIWDRLLGLNLFAAQLLILIVLIALFRETTYILDLALVYALFGFIGIIFISIYIQQGKDKY